MTSSISQNTPHRMKSLPPELSALALYKQFLLYKLVHMPDGSTKKLPVDHRTSQVFEKDQDWQHNPDALTDHVTAFNLLQFLDDDHGVGFFFTPQDPFYFCDIDKCLLPDNTWSPVAQDIMSRLPGAAIEVSQSGTGLHIIGMGVTPDHACKNIDLGLELYTEGRFVALTGYNIIGDAGTDNSATLAALVNDYFPPKITERGTEWDNDSVLEYTGNRDDDQLIKKMLKSKSGGNAFGGKASFKQLFENDQKALAEYFTKEDGQIDYSSVDAALAQHLAFWTGCNHERILTLMKRSALVRDKWDRDDYLIRTITRAVSLQKTVYTVGTSVEPVKNPLGTTEPTFSEGYQFLGLTQQLEHFKGCTYIQDIHRVITPNGSLLNSERFNATYGGYTFQLESDSGGKDTRKAWEAFTESQAIRYPKAESMCFRPELKPLTIIKENHRTLVNTYVPALGERNKGDVSLYLNHVKRLIPDPNDRDIFHSYMAACVQRPGIKFQWCVLLQGIEGNGKTFFYSVLVYALGERYTHIPKASDIDNKFNGWIENKLIIGIEELHTAGRQEVADTLKPLITNKRIEIHGKGQDQRTGDNRANFIMFSNHKDAVLKTENDRRYCVFYTAQQESSDLIRDGMNSNYFSTLYRWAESGGYACIAEYLTTLSVNIDVMGRAPVTTSTAEAVRSSLGVAEQLILEAIELDEYGFRGELICTKTAAELLKSHGKKLSPQRVAIVLTNIGYIKHPALEASRGTVKVGGRLHRLYVKKGSLTAQLFTPKMVADAFIKYQGVAVATFGAVAT